ncbi:exodeoxyribonuclease V subunit beta [Denitratisoma sp. DHT3]|uniref:exodeoxyribonuclease V subunit beta n=1 Tax=Denitratisoma sp. DHT3 TaxID=1981880 RepID=UPI001648B58C|nr:exodeoxyribonuclease V subunit beta [Denitratisoma sp. DHT3]
MRALEAQSVPLAGVQAIEASAGTGKTWSIAALYLRLVLEAGLPVERVLVVTYTNAATAELRSRIRARLAEAREVFQARLDEPVAAAADPTPAPTPDPTPDPVLAALLAALDPRLAVARLTLAIESFDLAAIHTIHGFCQRALAERAFESGQPFEAELSADDTALLRQGAQDLWRRELDAADPAWAGWLAERLAGPEALLAALRPHLGKPYLQRLAPPPWDRTAEDALAAILDDVRGQWRARAPAVLAMLRQWPGLSQSSYKPARIDKAAEAVGAWLEQTDTQGGDGNGGGGAPKKEIALFTPAKLEAGTTKKAMQETGPPQDPLFAALETLLDRLDAADEARQRRLGQWLHDALAAADAALAERKARRGLLSFDDLLLRLHQGLTGEGGDALAAALAERYQAALIDEFQDTDPIQFAIFQRVFGAGGRPLFFVGDPKQAIYSFRGADLQAYLEARAAAGEPWVLGTNRRSVPPLVDAVNAVFARRAAPFIDSRLAFQAVAAAPSPPPPLVIDGEEPGHCAPFLIWRLTREEGQKSIPKGHATARILRAVAADIARLLALGAAGRARLGEGSGARPLCGGDIAVLVRGHHQGRQMREALAALNVASVRYGQDSVFHSREALEVERLLLAVAEPGREGLVRAALATDLLGLRGAELDALARDPARWQARLDRFQEWHGLCRDQGFIRMWRALLVEEGVAARLLAHPDGERRMTNLQHLSELLQQLSHHHGGSVGQDAAALAKRIADERDGAGAGLDGEARQLRLESDEQVVKIVTVHASKGLEYPIVYCPFLWDAGGRREDDGPLRFHDPADGHRAKLDFGSPRRDIHARQAAQERREELLRLAYVALTRAKHRCVLAWGPMTDAGDSAPAWLFHGAEPADFTGLDDAALGADLEALAADCPAIAVVPLPDADGTPLAPPATEALGASAGPTLAARVFHGRVAASWRTHSFSGWLATADAELPDHDATVRTPSLADEEKEAESAPAHVDDLFADLLPLASPAASAASAVSTASDALAAGAGEFPRGAEAGSALHALLERGRFDAFDADAVADTLQAFGFGAEWTPAAASLVRNTLAADLDGHGLRLADLDPARTLREMEFLFPVASPDIARLARAIGPGQGADGRLAERVAELAPAQAAGFLKGYIDLVCEHRGRLYLLDYKSNWLGARAADYGAEALARAMAAENYDLQALLYTVALHRLQRLRRAGYDYARHMGGALYLFLRGIEPGVGASGVFAWRPDAGLVARVDACLTRRQRFFE